MKRSLCIATTSILLGTLSACSTPQAALDHANNTAGLSVALGKEVENLRTTQARIARNRLTSIEGLNASMATFDVDTRWRNDIQELAGNGDRLRLMSTLRNAADARGTYEAELRSTLEAQRKANAELVAPLPSQSAALKELGEKLGGLGEELSHRERLDIVAKFAKELKKSVDENRDKIKEAQGKQPTPPKLEDVPTPSSN